MTYNNFSNIYKKTLINSENEAKKKWVRELRIEDIFIELIDNIKWNTQELFKVYWIDKKLILEITNKSIFNESPKKRKGVYSWMSNKLKEIILNSVKIAASYYKDKASTEDFILSSIRNDTWIWSVLDYIWVNVSDFEKNIVELNKSWTIDWIASHTWIRWNTDVSNQSGIINWIWDKNYISNEMNKFLWNLNENLFWMNNSEDWISPFDLNKTVPWNLETKSETPALDFFSIDLTNQAKEEKIDKVIGRDNEINRLIAILNRKTKNNPVLIWEPWVWKTAIVEWLAKKIYEKNVPFSMKNKKILSLDMTLLIAWTKYRWEFETRIKQIIEEASKAENEVILFIDEIHTIIWAWSTEWWLDASNILKPAMWRWKIRIIWATTLNEYSKYIEKDSALERRFQKIDVAEPDNKTSMEIIFWLKDIFEEYHNLNISNEAIEEAVNLSTRYINDRYLPDKAIDLIDEACSLKSMKYNFDEKETLKLKEKISEIVKNIESAVINQNYKKASELKNKQDEYEKEIINIKSKFKIPKNKRLTILADDIQKILSLSTWIPVNNLNKDDINKLKKLSNTLKNSIIGQDEAIDKLVKSIMRNKVWIWNINRPLWSFLFLGPTWVWKTELVKKLEKEFYWNEQSLIKIDMSEYSEKTSVSKLIWANAWYIWYEEWWFLTEKVRKKPYSIILFDEIEKWDLDVYNILLQILEDWVLTDNKWRKVNFKNTIIIMTSNIWHEEFTNKASQIWFDLSEEAEKKILKDYKKIKENIVNWLTNYFPAEFINRIDKIIVFNPLDKEIIKKIVKLKLSELVDNLKTKNISLEYESKIINFIWKETYNQEFWAREIRRYIMDNIEDIIAEMIINNPNKNKFEIKLEKKKIVIK